MPQPPALPSPWRLASLLGEGGLAEVWLAQEGEGGPMWALKLLRPDLPDPLAAEAALLREHSLLRDLAHPRLVAVGQVGRSLDGRAFYAMEALKATPEAGAWPPEAVREGLKDALQALGRLHAAGWVHGDVSPHNFLQGPDGHLRLSDLGLVRPMGQAEAKLSGTLAYLAPELARQEPVDGRADLYALACVAQAWLCGQPPFPHQDAADLVRAHLNEAPAPLPPGLPPDLVAWVGRNLAKAVGLRHASAQAALADLGGLLEGRPPLLQPGLVGREALLDEATEALGQGQSLALHAPAGAGASALLGHLAQRLQSQGRRPMWVRAAGGGALVALGPALAELGLSSAVLGAEKGEAAWLSPTRWRELLAGAVLLVDAPEGLDEASQQALKAWRPWAPQIWVLPEGAEAPDPAWGRLALAPLGAKELGELAARTLALPSVPGAWGGALRAASGGLPGQAWRALQTWVEGGGLPHQGGQWQLEQAKLTALVPVEAPDAQWALRLAQWPSPALALAQAWACAHGPVPLAQVAQAAGLGAAEAAGAAAHLASLGAWTTPEALALRPPLARALRGAMGPKQVAACHGAWLASLGLEATSARAWHALRAGQAAAEAGPLLAEGRLLLQVRALAELRQLLEALKPWEALPQAAQAEAWALMGEWARRQGQPAEAAEAFTQALALRQGGPKAAWWASLSVAKQMAGDAAGAWAAAEAARDAGLAEGQQAEALRGAVRLARLAHGQGRPEARALAEAALAMARALGQAHKEAEALGLLALLLQGEDPAGAYALAQEAVALQRGLGEAGDPGDLLSALDMAANLDLSAGRHAAALAGFQEVAEWAARMGGQGDEEALACVNQAAALTELGRVGEALPLVQAGWQALVAKGSRFLAAYAEALLGHLLVLVGRLAEGQGHLEGAWVEAEAQASGYLKKLVGMHLAEGFWWLGEPDEALRYAELALPLSEPGDEAHDRLLAQALAAQAVLKRWRGLPERVAAVRARVAAGAAEAPRLALAMRVLAGQVDAPLGAALAWGPAEALALPQPEAPAVAGEWLLWRGALLGLSPGAEAEAAEAARLAQEALAKGGQAWPAAVAALWRASWSADADAQAAGRSAALAWQAMVGGLGASGQAGLRAWWWREAWDQDEALGDLGELSVKALLARARQAGRVDESAARVAAFGRLVTGSLDLGVVLERAVEEAMALVGAERGMITLLDEAGAMAGLVVRPREAVADDGLMNFSRSLVEAALLEDRAIALADAQSDSRFGAAASVMALDLRTVVCVPLRAEGQPLGVLYLDRQSVSARFGAEALALVEGIASFAALAIANARQHAAAQARLSLLEAYQALRGLDQLHKPLAEPLSAAVAQAQRLLGGQAASFWIPSEAGWSPEVVSGAGPVGEPDQVAQAAQARGLLEADGALYAPIQAGVSLAGVLVVALPNEGLPAEPPQWEALASLSQAMGRALTGRGKAERLARREAWAKGALAHVLARKAPGARDATSGLSSRGSLQAWLGEAEAQAGLLVGIRLPLQLDKEAWLALATALDGLAHLGGRAARWGPLEALAWVPVGALPPEAYLPGLREQLPAEAHLGTAGWQPQEDAAAWAARAFTPPLAE